MIANWVHAMPTPEAYRVNKILYDVQHDRAEEARYFADPAAYVAGFPQLAPASARALIENDIGRLYVLGANPYLLRAYCLQLKVPEQDYLAALRAVSEIVDHG